ncbi:hypothetical protein EJ03DRAFT_207099 [Teratosphaeria nubilosa]|uniref:Uncharacterized protein n=1 Tax=Teratosphaeria nubilosa TaxID=161662 RepID=A0A6G1KYW5_9PEZI|nr:hypothetical protein EJ03DRAFT_207099 [Teratosphaeria nubilosa]
MFYAHPRSFEDTVELLGPELRSGMVFEEYTVPGSLFQKIFCGWLNRRLCGRIVVRRGLGLKEMASLLNS